MAEERRLVTTYRGVPIYYWPATDSYEFEYGLTTYAMPFGVAEIKALIDTWLGAEGVAPPVEELITPPPPPPPTPPSEALSWYENWEGVQIWFNRDLGTYSVMWQGTLQGEYRTVQEAEAAVDALVALPTIIPVAVPKTVDIPGLPWYLTWLKPVLDYIGTLAEGITNHFTKLLAPAITMSQDVQKLTQDLKLKGVTSAGTAADAVTTEGHNVALQTLTDLNKGTPDWMTELRTQASLLASPILDQCLKAIDVTEYAHSLVTGSEALASLNTMRNLIVAGGVASWGLHVVTEAASLGQYEFVSQITPMVVSKLGLDALANEITLMPIRKALLVPAEQQLNAENPYMIPSYQDLINMVVKEVIPLDEFKASMKLQGFKEEWSQKIWDAHFVPPDWTEIKNAYYRGVLTLKELDAMQILVDLDQRYKQVFDASVEVIPAYSELTNELVKEVIDLPTYTKYLQWHGFNPIWAKRIWDAHFIPPTLGDILTAWRRGKIGETDVDRLMILVDLDPRFKDIFDTRKYIDPSISLARFMFETGAINQEGVHDIVTRNGFRPDDAKVITDYIVRFQERMWRRRYLVALEAGVRVGAVPEGEFEKEVLEAGYQPEVGEWMLKTGSVRQRIARSRPTPPKLKLLSVGDLKRAYMLDKYSPDQMRTELQLRGFEESDINLLFAVLDSDKVTTEAGGRKVALTQAELVNAWRYDELTEDTLRTALLLRGMELAEVDMLIATKKKQWGVGGIE